MIWYIAESNTLKEMSEEVLIYKIKNGEIDPGTLVVNEKIREWTTLHEMAIWRNNFKQTKDFAVENTSEGSYNEKSKTADHSECPKGDWNVSEAVYSTSQGWFRYNYDQSRLEFLSHKTKVVLYTWAIPADQWESLQSKRQYCENIVIEANQQKAKEQNAKRGNSLIFIISAIITVVLTIIFLYEYFNNITLNYDVLIAGWIISFGIASSTYWKYK